MTQGVETQMKPADLLPKLGALKEKLSRSAKSMHGNEEATKMGLIVPFIRGLGYDPNNPSEVTPEYSANFGVKKDQVVDYGISLDGQIVFVVECKPLGDTLAKGSSQLARYFAATPARIGILTNGQEYQFYADTDKTNLMDRQPYFVFDLLNFHDDDVRRLLEYSKQQILSKLGDSGYLRDLAEALKYKNLIKNELQKEQNNPSDDLVKLFTKRVHPNKRANKKDMPKFREIIRTAFRDSMREEVKKILSSSMDSLSDKPEEAMPKEERKSEHRVDPSPEELSALLVVKAIASPVVEQDRLVIRKNKSYSVVNLDDTQRKPVVRFRFSSPSKKKIGLFDGEAKIENQIVVNTVFDIGKHSNRLLKAIKRYL